MPNRIEMSHGRRLSRRVRAMGRDKWMLLLEAGAALAVASLAIAFLPFRTIVNLASRKRGRGTPRGGRTGQKDIVWAVDAMARRVPWRTVCFQKGLALHWMLRRRGIASILHYGVGKDEEGALAAHVWIAVGDRIVQGQDVVDRFHRMASYPPSADR